MNLYHVYTKLLSSGSFWILSSVAMVAGLLPDYTLKAISALDIKLKKLYPGNSQMGTRRSKKVAPIDSQTTYL